jgi:hypothetical protein
MTATLLDGILQEVSVDLDIPDHAYQKAEDRYKDVGEWLSRPESTCRQFSPHVYPQGSFRFGTVVRPLNDGDDYDLDLGCRLRRGISKATHSQFSLKSLVGVELEKYRQARRIKSNLEEMHRCWRLQYADELEFHMDVVPSIPESLARRVGLVESMAQRGISRDLAQQVAELTGAITDDRHPGYRSLVEDWRISNSEGYAKWFESRMRLAPTLLQEHAMRARVATIDALPTYRWKSPLQLSIQVLKRHRDVMFRDNPDSKPISIILTTLAARSYRGERDLETSLVSILNGMAQEVQPMEPRIPNPVNPLEDFADRWRDPVYAHLHLEGNFWSWLDRASADLASFQRAASTRQIAETANKMFSTEINPERLGARLGLLAPVSLVGKAAVPSSLTFPNKPIVPSKPAGFAGPQ